MIRQSVVQTGVGLEEGLDRSRPIEEGETLVTTSNGGFRRLGESFTVYPLDGTRVLFTRATVQYKKDGGVHDTLVSGATITPSMVVFADGTKVPIEGLVNGQLLNILQVPA